MRRTTSEAFNFNDKKKSIIKSSFNICGGNIYDGEKKHRLKKRKNQIVINVSGLRLSAPKTYFKKRDIRLLEMLPRNLSGLSITTTGTHTEMCTGRIKWLLVRF